MLCEEMGWELGWFGLQKGKAGGSHCRGAGGIRIPTDPSLSCKCTVKGQEAMVSCCSKILSQQKEHLICHEGPAALGQAAQGGCRISILGNSRIHVDKTLE